MAESSVTQEAHALVHADRGQVYGHPIDNFSQTAALWAAYKGVEFSAEDVAIFMMLVKISRLSNSPDHHDSVVDIAGYAETLGMVQDKRKERPDE